MNYQHYFWPEKKIYLSSNNIDFFSNWKNQWLIKELITIHLWNTRETLYYWVIRFAAIIDLHDQLKWNVLWFHDFSRGNLYFKHAMHFVIASTDLLFLSVRLTNWVVIVGVVSSSMLSVMKIVCLTVSVLLLNRNTDYHSVELFHYV